MKKRIRILVAFLLILSMTAVMFVGCGPSSEGDESSVSGSEAVEYFDEDVTYEIEFDGEVTPVAPVEETAEIGEEEIGKIEDTVFAQDVNVDTEQMQFVPLSEEEIAEIAEEVREEIEEEAIREEEAAEGEEPDAASSSSVSSSSASEAVSAVSVSAGSSAEIASESPEVSPEVASNSSGNTQTAAPGGEEYTAVNTGSAPKQLTIEDIQAMNPDTVVIDIYSNRGYLSTLVGKYYDKKVTNVEEGVLSIQPMASLLGLSKGCDFFAVYSEKNDKGYTFYTYQQRYGGYTLQYATLRIVVDPMGYTAGLSCSFVPNVGTASKADAITKKQAEQIVQKKFASKNLKYYPDKTVRLAVPFNNAVYNCWVVYTSNPDADPAFDMPYLEHCITTDGEYLTVIPANGFATSNAEVQDNSGYFEGLQVQDYTATFKMQDGSIREITVPVSYNKKDGKYYLIDPSRKIAVAQYYDFNYKGGKVNFVTSKTVGGWSENNILAYASYITCYDFYASHGIRSVDGFGVPILITVGWCDENRNPVNNACFYGVNDGWACFGVSDINYWYECIDVVGHEYTHGITNRSMQGVLYRNETGSINESYSDIMGNLIEMSGNFTTDRTWKNAEVGGKINRDLGNPNKYKQPQFVGDQYYVPAVLNPDYAVNDYGGVHINNSLIGHIAYLMDQAGMSYEEQISMWLTSIELITPRSDYQDLHGALLFSLKINGLLGSYGSALNQAFKDAGLNDNWNESYLTAKKSGYGRIILPTDKEIAKTASTVLFATTDLSVVGNAYPDENGVVSILLPAGTYIAQLVLNKDNTKKYYNYTPNGWVEDGQFLGFKVQNGGVVDYTTRSGQSSKTPTPTPAPSNNKLNLVNFDAGYFSMLVPQGWKIEVFGEYSYFGVKIFDPNDPSTQMFFFGGLSPYHKSEAARKFWALYDSTGIISNGPVLTSHDVVGILNCWAYTVEYQKYYDKQYFPDLSNIKVIGGYNYTGPSAKFKGIETACYATCSTKWKKDCILTMTSALIDDDIFGVYGGNWFYSCHDMCGVLAPKDRYKDVYVDLVRCIESLKFSQNYIIQSQSSEFPLADQATITASLRVLGDVIIQIVQKNLK